jgi:hypothetical protein
MSYSRSAIILFCCAALLVPSLSGQTVVAIGNQSKELKRTAHQLRISAEHLRNAREALQQATDLARRNPDSLALSQLAQNWIRLDKNKAPAALEDLYSWLGTAARDAADAMSYQRFTSSAQMLLRSYASLDSERAAGLWQQWPDPPASLGEALKKNQTESAALFAKQLAGQGTGPGVSMGMNVSTLREAAARGNYSSTAQLATQMAQTGDKAEALKLVDQAILDFRQREPDQRTLSSYRSFVVQLPYVDPDRYLLALSALLPALDKQGTPNTGGTVSIGDQTIQVTASEAVVIDMCRSLTGRPDLAMKTLNSMPGLKSKLDRIGGIDSISAIPGRGSQLPVSLNYSIDGLTRTTYNSTGSGSSGGTGPISSPGGAGPLAGMDLYQSLRGKLAKDPAFVRQKLAEASKTPDQVDALVMLANRAGAQEPDLASMALDAATKLLVQVEPLQKRASVLQNMMRAYQSCDGEVDADLLQKGLALVQQLREEEKNNPPANQMPRGAVNIRMSSMADQLEMTIVAELALENFDGAMRYLRLMPDEMRLQALLRIVQSLVQSY